MALATQQRPSTSTLSDASLTVTIHEVQSNPDANMTVGVLRLRGGPHRNRPRVAWDEDVVDNEGCGRKKSKICCIYHRPKRFDESSDEDSSDSDSNSSCDHSSHSHSHSRPARPPTDDASGGGGIRARDGQSSGVVHELERHEPNAYEKMPPSSKKGKNRAV